MVAYELTGPRLLTFEEAVDETAVATGRELRYVPVSMAEFEALLAEQEVPADFVWLLTYLFGEVLDGRNAHLTDGVQRALGREPKDFADFARDAAAAGAWTPGCHRVTMSAAITAKSPSRQVGDAVNPACPSQRTWSGTVLGKS
jgi:hypothetical protein